MLADRRVYAKIPAADLERARRWYEEKLGLKPTSREEAGLIYELGEGTGFLLYATSLAGKAPNTLASFSSTDIKADIAALEKRGVVFEDYDLPGLKTENHIATMGTRHGAWFKDSDGNILALSG